MNFDISEINGGTVLTMRGDNCLCIASDLRLGERMLTIVDNKSKIYRMGDRLYVGLAGFASDAESVVQRLTFRKNLYELRENRAMRPQTFSQMLSNLLYEKRFGPYFCEPLVAGLDPITSEPYIAGMDHIGCICSPQDFICVGTGSSGLMGICEAIWEPNMDSDALFEATSQAMLSAMERDAISGWGVVVYTVTKEKVSIKTIKCRVD